MRNMKLILVLVVVNGLLINLAHASKIKIQPIAQLSSFVGNGLIKSGKDLLLKKGGGIKSKLKALSMIAGGKIVNFIDPPAGSFYSGSFSIHYDSSLMQPIDSGWLGDWGLNAALLAPPVDSDLWDDTPVTLQQANSALTDSVVDDPLSGLLQVAFDWGPSGHVVNTVDPFNLFGAVFEFNTNVNFTYLGDFASAPADANFYVTTPGLSCTLPATGTALQTCGEETTSFFQVTKVEEPNSFALVLLALAGGVGWHQARRTNKN